MKLTFISYKKSIHFKENQFILIALYDKDLMQWVYTKEIKIACVYYIE